jgi:hypothetical protein
MYNEKCLGQTMNKLPFLNAISIQRFVLYSLHAIMIVFLLNMAQMLFLVHSYLCFWRNHCLWFCLSLGFDFVLNFIHEWKSDLPIVYMALGMHILFINYISLEAKEAMLPLEGKVKIIRAYHDDEDVYK